MALQAGTFQSTSAVGNREQLSNIVNRITPEETPIYTMIEKGKTGGTHPEWEIDELAAPAANAQLEGDEYTFGATTPPVKVGNYTQIFRKTGAVSGTQEAVDNAGDVEKLKEQKLKKGIEARRDVELSIVSPAASVDGATRVSGGIPSWLTSNVSRGAGGANGGFNTTTKLTVAPTVGTQRSFSKALLDTVVNMSYTSGGRVSKLVTAPYAKTVFATFMSDANVAGLRTMITKSGKNTLSGSVDVYQGPLGTVEIEPNIVMANSASVARRALVLDPAMLEWLWLRKIAEDTGLAKTGDKTSFAIIGEGALKVKNQAAHGSVEDIFGLNAAA